MIRRRLRTCLSALSLILCVGTAVLWVRSEFVRDDVFMVDWRMGCGASVGRGYIYLWQASTLNQQSWPPQYRFRWQFHHDVTRPAVSVS